MNYFFLYQLSDGSIFGSPYLGDAEEWTNIPEGCGVIGPIHKEDSEAKDASENPDFYTIQNGALTPVSDIAERRAAKEAERQARLNLPTDSQRMDNLEAVINNILMGGI